MANNLNSNPLFLDTTGATSEWGHYADPGGTSAKQVKLFQWVGSGGDIADNDTCVMVVNGVTLTAAIERPTDVGFSPTVLWELDFGPSGISWNSFSLTTIGTGVVHIWLI